MAAGREGRNVFHDDNYKWIFGATGLKSIYWQYLPEEERRKATKRAEDEVTVVVVDARFFYVHEARQKRLLRKEFSHVEWASDQKQNTSKCRQPEQILHESVNSRQTNPQQIKLQGVTEFLPLNKQE